MYVAVYKNTLCWAGIAIAALLGLSGQAYGRSEEEVRKLAELELKQLAELPIVSAARHRQSKSDSPRAVSVITAEQIRKRNFRNVPEAISELSGVFLQQTNYAGGSPIIRGVVGNRILILLNGIRLNNATFRLGA